MFPAVVSSKLEAAIADEEERKRERVQAEQGKGRALGDKKGARLSEFETLLNEYSKIEADEITVRVIIQTSVFHSVDLEDGWQASSTGAFD